jgi:hypothetical protein
MFNEPRFLDTPDGKSRLLVDALTFELTMGEGGRIQLVVPAGFISNLASVPRPLWSIVPPFGAYNRAAIIHDYLYVSGGECSRFLADAIFREAMHQLGIPLWRRVVMFYAVRWFGWIGFNRESLTYPEQARAEQLVEDFEEGVERTPEQLLSDPPEKP